METTIYMRRAGQNFPVYIFAEEKVKATEGLNGNGWINISPWAVVERQWWRATIGRQNQHLKKDFYEG